jgi:hypothetical protein
VVNSCWCAGADGCCCGADGGRRDVEMGLRES